MRLALVPAVLAIAVAGCGESSSSSSSKPPDADTKELTELQDAAADLVRETDYEDAAGAKRAMAELQDKAGGAEELLGPEPAEELDRAVGEAEEAIGGKDYEEANEAAKEALAAVNEAGEDAAVATGVKGQLKQLEAAARDMTQEVENGDKPGSKRAYAAFKDLFATAREPIEEKSRESAETIERALDRVRDDLPSTDADELADAGEELAEAVESAVGELGG